MASGSGVQYIPGGGPSAVTQWQGVYAGYIAVNVDPLDQGRVKLRVPQVFGNVTSGWASPMVPVSYIPKVATAVTVMFVGGDPSRPVWGGNFAIPGGSAGFVVAAAEPASPQLGEVWVNTATGLMSEWNGAAWVGYQIGGAAIQTAVSLQQPNISGGTITGAQFIADGTSGEFLGYTGSPTTGNMNVSVSPVAGTDSKDNDYVDGVTVYDGSAYIQVSVNSTVGAPAVGMKTGVTSEAGVATLYTWSPNKGAANESLISWLQGPSSTVDSASAAIVLQSTAKDNSTKAYGGLVFDGAVIASWNASGVNVPDLTVTGTLTAGSTARKTGGFSGYPVISQTGGGGNASTTTATPVSASYAIPANDAQDTTVYRVKASGFGLTGSTAYDLGFGIEAFGATASVTFDSTIIPNGVNFNFTAEGTVAVTSNGSGGQAQFNITATITQSSSHATSAISVTGTDTSFNVSVNTTAATTIAVVASVGGTAGAPFIDGMFSTCERLGP